MNGLLKTLGAVALFAMLVPAAAGAQQTTKSGWKSIRAAGSARSGGSEGFGVQGCLCALEDYVGSMMSSVASIFDMLGKGSMLTGGVPELTQSATFTFEITP